MNRYLSGIILALLVIFGNACNGNTNKPFFSLSFEEIFKESSAAMDLAKAVDKADLSAIEKLVSKGADINFKGSHGLTVLYWSLKTHNKKSFRELLELGANPNQFLGKSYSVIFLAAGMEDSDYLKLALEYGGDPNLVDPRELETPLFRTIMPEGKNNLKLLVEANADLNHKNIYGNTALLEAAGLGQYDVVYKLIMFGADYSIRNRWGNGLNYFLDESNNMKKSSELYEWRNKVIDLIKMKMGQA